MRFKKDGFERDGFERDGPKLSHFIKLYQYRSHLFEPYSFLLKSDTIAQKIGGEYPMNAVFVGRVFTGEIYHEELGCAHPDRDWILSRILWLDGCEDGVNKGKNADGVCDTFSRYIYIHGTPDTEPMGKPMSHGCVRMRNEDIVWLYDVVDVGTAVNIV